MGCGCNRRNFSTIKIKTNEVVPPVKREVVNNAEGRKQKIADVMKTIKERHQSMDDILARQPPAKPVAKIENKPNIVIPITINAPKQAPILSKQQKPADKQSKKPNGILGFFQKLFKK